MSRLVEFDKSVIQYLKYHCYYRAIRDSNKTFNFFEEDNIKHLDPKVYLAVPELDFRDGVELGTPDDMNVAFHFKSLTPQPPQPPTLGKHAPQTQWQVAPALTIF